MSASGGRDGVTVVFQNGDGSWPQRPAGWRMVIWKGLSNAALPIDATHALVNVDEYEQITTLP